MKHDGGLWLLLAILILIVGSLFTFLFMQGTSQDRDAASCVEQGRIPMETHSFFEDIVCVDPAGVTQP